MQMLRKRLGITALAACLLVALAFGGVVAWAVGVWPLPEGPNTLTITAAQNDSRNQTDLASALSDESDPLVLVADVYKVATATPSSTYVTYDYELLKKFADDPDVLKAYNAAVVGHAADWETFANKAAKIVDVDNPDYTLTFDSNGIATGQLADGLYIILPHGAGEAANSLVAKTSTMKYTFSAYAISLPTTYNDSYESTGYLEGDVNTADPDGWFRDVTVALKAEQEPLYGNLKITKRITEATKQRVSFDFLVESVECPADPNYKYKDYVTITFDPGDKTTKTVQIKDLPAGATFKVTETYDGASYTLVPEKSDVREEGYVIQAEEVVEVTEGPTFVNKPDSDTEGYAINNKFKFDEGKGWVLVEDAVTPEDALHEDPNKPKN